MNTTLQPRLRQAHLSRGSALIAVFWVMAILSLAVFAAVRVVYHDADIAASQINGFDALLAAERGIAVAANPSVKDNQEPLLSGYDEETDTSYRARITSEAARFNINTLLLKKDKPLLTHIFTGWGMELEAAQTLVDNLIDWTDAGDETELNGAEIDWYEGVGRRNQPFNHPFYNLDEMKLVKDMDLLNAVKPDWETWFTIWSNGQLDVNEADAELIAAAAEVSLEKAQDIVDYVLGPDHERYTEDDQRFEAVQEVIEMMNLSEIQASIVLPRLTVNAKVTRIISDGRAGTLNRRITLILKDRSTHPTILFRKEEILP